MCNVHMVLSYYHFVETKITLEEGRGVEGRPGGELTNAVFNSWMHMICLTFLNEFEYPLNLLCYCIIATVSTRIWDNPYEGQIRLIKGYRSNQGLLEVYCNGEWGTVCDDGFDAVDAHVACRQLGYRTYYAYDHLSLSVILFRNNFVCELTSFQHSLALNEIIMMVWIVYACYVMLAAVLAIHTHAVTIISTDSLVVMKFGEHSKFKKSIFDLTMILFSFCRSGRSGQSIWYTNLVCSSSSLTCLSQCQPCRTTSVLTCFHFEDITLDCGKQEMKSVSCMIIVRLHEIGNLIESASFYDMLLAV